MVGESGVGKSGIAKRLTEGIFEATISTDGHWATQVLLPHDSSTEDTDREIWLWDFAGQSDYRLIHQLFMDETALAILVFNPQTENLFEGLGQWDQDITLAARRKRFNKILVAGRCDVGGLMVSRSSVDQFCQERNFATYIETSAKTGQGCEDLKQAIINTIDWETIPYTSSPRIFKLLKNEILNLRDEDQTLLRLSELNQHLHLRLPQETFTYDQLKAVVGLLAGPGIIWDLGFGDYILLHPEKINTYAAAVIRTIRANDYGNIPEEKILNRDLEFKAMDRLPDYEEDVVLRAMYQLFIQKELCLREHTGAGTQLIFPSFFRRELHEDPGHPPILVSYTFQGSHTEIYATLVVRLLYTEAFDNDQLWRYAVDFRTPKDKRFGLKMIRRQEGAAQLNAYFDPEIDEDTKVTFIRYMHEHLNRKAKDVKRHRRYTCPHCGLPVQNNEIVRKVLEKKGKDAELRCQDPDCDQFFSLWDVIEQKFNSEEFRRKIQELDDRADARRDNESKEQILVGEVLARTAEAGHIFRPILNSDHGIDGEIEFKDWQGNASGQRLYLQLKSGDSHLQKRKRDAADIFRIDNPRWSSYWQQHAYPVMLVIRNSAGEIRWMDVSEYLKRHSQNRKTPIKQIPFTGEPFNVRSIQRLRDRYLSLDPSQSTGS